MYCQESWVARCPVSDVWWSWYASATSAGGGWPGECSRTWNGGGSISSRHYPSHQLYSRVYLYIILFDWSAVFFCSILNFFYGFWINCLGSWKIRNSRLDFIFNTADILLFLRGVMFRVSDRFVYYFLRAVVARGMFSHEGAFWLRQLIRRTFFGFAVSSTWDTNYTLEFFSHCRKVALQMSPARQCHRRKYFDF